MRCNEQTVMRLLRYFEDVVTENNLSALVVEGRCLDGHASRERERLGKLKGVARFLYLFSCDQQCQSRTWHCESNDTQCLLEERDYHNIETGPFVLIMDNRFCALLASNELPQKASNGSRTYEMIWTFDPNVIFTGIEYLLARISAQWPDERQRFGTLLNASTPHSQSLRLALSFTTKLTTLMHRQNEIEMATNRISSAISSTLELESILQSAVEEVGSALNARRAVLALWREEDGNPESASVYERPQESYEDDQSKADNQLRLASIRVDENHSTTLVPIEVPITYRNTVIGSLRVEDNTPERDWENEEILMVKTVSDQLAVAISHARLFQQVQMQAMTDSLTGLFNHRYFQERLDREISLCDRNGGKLSLILLDLDHLKRINDTHGHRAGDTALQHVASVMRKTVREVDICVRYGGEEFVIVLPDCGRESAIEVAERLRESIASVPVEKIGQVTASIGVASYPSSASTKIELIEMADRAMYFAKAAGRNRVRTLIHRAYNQLTA